MSSGLLNAVPRKPDLRLAPFVVLTAHKRGKLFLKRPLNPLGRPIIVRYGERYLREVAERSPINLDVRKNLSQYRLQQMAHGRCYKNPEDKGCNEHTVGCKEGVQSWQGHTLFKDTHDCVDSLKRAAKSRDAKLNQ